MNEDEAFQLARRDIEPLLAASLKLVPPPVKRRKRGGRWAPGNIAWISLPASDNEISVERSLPFTTWESGILEPYGDALADLKGVEDWVLRAASDEVALRAISVQVGGANSATIEDCLRFLLERAGTTYEGQAVHLNFLVDLEAVESNTSKPLVMNFVDHEWHALLGSGLKTGMALDKTGRAIAVVDLPPSSENSLNALRPDIFGAIGNWTSSSSSRVALSVTRSRELLVHQDGQLKLIYRAGRWRGMPFEAVAAKRWSSGANISSPAKIGVLASVTDACVGHHGAAIGIVSRGNITSFRGSDVIKESDLWPKNVRAGLFPQGKFQDLPRRLRLEMLSMDGATVLDHTGEILTAGAIVKVPSGSTGGGRLAAVKALAQFGAAIKVSQDGPARVYGASDSGVELVASLA
jgi:hypothetical protein